MEIKDNGIDGIKPYRDKTPTVDNDKKSTQQGVMITDQTDEDGTYTMSQGGDEAGWTYTPNKTAEERHDLGSWSQVVPAVWRGSDNKIVPLLDKLQTVDTNYYEKDIDTEAGDTALKASILDTEGDGTVETEGIPGVVVTCLNDASQEQIFIPAGSRTNAMIGYITAYDPTTAKITFTVPWNDWDVDRYAVAMYQGQNGKPLATEVVVGTFAAFYRIGTKNVNFSSVQPSFQFGDETTTDKASYVAFFFPATEV